MSSYLINPTPRDQYLLKQMLLYNETQILQGTLFQRHPLSAIICIREKANAYEGPMCNSLSRSPAGHPAFTLRSKLRAHRPIFG